MKHTKFFSWSECECSAAVSHWHLVWRQKKVMLSQWGFPLPYWAEFDEQYINLGSLLFCSCYCFIKTTQAAFQQCCFAEHYNKATAGKSQEFMHHWTGNVSWEEEHTPFGDLPVLTTVSKDSRKCLVCSQKNLPRVWATRSPHEDIPAWQNTPFTTKRKRHLLKNELKTRFGAQGADICVEPLQAPGTTSPCPCLFAAALFCSMLSMSSSACSRFTWNWNEAGSVFSHVSLSHIIEHGPRVVIWTYWVLSARRTFSLCQKGLKETSCSTQHTPLP